MRSRGLGDVLHYFIAEDEQRESRDRAHRDRAHRDRAHRDDVDPPRETQCWVLPTAPDRPLSCTVALELAVAATRGGFPARVFAPFPKEQLLLHSADVRWQELPADETGSRLAREIRDALSSETPGMGLDLLVLRPKQLCSVLPELGDERLAGVLLPIDAVPGGAAQTLAWLRQLPPMADGLRIGAMVIGAREREEARELFTKVHRAVSRQLGLRVEDLGELLRDPASFKALLRGVPVVEFDPDALSAQSLLALSRRLVESGSESGSSAASSS